MHGTGVRLRRSHFHLKRRPPQKHALAVARPMCTGCSRWCSHSAMVQHAATKIIQEGGGMRGVDAPGASLHVAVMSCWS